MIEVENLSFEYPSVRALDRISFSISEGAIAALVGPNGAGKTTLLRLLAALERPYEGHVKVDGLDVVAHPRKVHERLGYLPDFFGLYEDLTVAQCLEFAARSRGIGPGAAAQAAERAAGLVDLDHRMQDAAGTLSRGLRQRLAIGQAIVHRPRVILLDEPASGLDPEARRRLSALFISLQSEGMTLVVSSHILAELEDYCTEMLVLEAGRLVGGKAVRVDEPASETVRVRLRLAAPDPSLAKLLADDPDTEVLEADKDSARLVLPAAPDARAAFLRKLVMTGFAVAEFAPERRRLEEAYFDEVAHSRKDEGGAS